MSSKHLEVVHPALQLTGALGWSIGCRTPC